MAATDTRLIINNSYEKPNTVKSKIFHNKSKSQHKNGEKENKPVRRKLRPRKPKTIQSVQAVPQIYFEIQALKSHINSLFLKPRNDKKRYVSIYSFLNDTRKTIIFQNSLCNQLYPNGTNKKHTRTNIKPLQNGTNIPKRRKYISIDLQYQNSSLKALEKRKSRWSKRTFTPYLTDDDLNKEDVKHNLIEGSIRINCKNRKEAYVSNSEEDKSDYLICNICDRNRALEGDIVYLKLKPKELWKENFITATVVYIKEKIHNRRAVGYITLNNDNEQTPILIPRDVRVPRMKIPKDNLPPNFYKQKKSFEKILFLAQLTDWRVPRYADGIILEQLGKENDIMTENRALLLEHNIDVTETPIAALKDVVNTETIPQDEIEKREDLRNECVFTIDPLTAKDLDDAVSLKELPNGNYEIGVHIADVTYYFQEDSTLDKSVRQKATSVYLVDKVYHMLPASLCFKCSLLPYKESLAFSVFWEFEENGTILSHRFSRTVIRSCAQLAYEHAQLMLDNPDKIFDDNELPPVFNGYDINKLSKIVNILQKFASKLRKKRFINGAIKINQPKLSFELDPIEKIPLGFSIQESKAANKLIEEFMLLANETVAQRILTDFPDIGFLRNHRPPLTRILNDVRKTLEYYDVNFNFETAGDIQSSIWAIDLKSEKGLAQLAVLNHLITKSMQRANYICTGICPSYHHYALSMDTYTHFTSPIRRYADIMVHRLLAASLGYRKKPKWTTDFVEKVALNCNKQKHLARKASDDSTALYLAAYIENHQPFVKKAVVCDVRDRSFEVLVLETGSCLRIQLNNLGEKIKAELEELDDRNYKIKLTYPAEGDLAEVVQKIELFETVYVQISKKSKCTKLIADLVRPF